LASPNCQIILHTYHKFYLILPHPYHILEVDVMQKPRNYRGVSLPDELVERVEQLIKKRGTYRTIAEFVSEAVRLRLETLEKREKTEEQT
jgi:predicted DNA-binding protein